MTFGPDAPPRTETYRSTVSDSKMADKLGRAIDGCGANAKNIDLVPAHAHGEPTGTLGPSYEMAIQEPARSGRLDR